MRENLDIKSFFQEWDRHNHYKVSPKQFRQALATCNFALTDEEFNALVARYRDQASGDMCYMIFLHDADPKRYPLKSANSECTTTVIGETYKYSGQLPKLYDVMQKIKNTVMQRRIRVEEFFLDHDPLRKGDVARSKFRSCLDELKYVFALLTSSMDLTPGDYEVLEQGFRSERDPERVNYVSFVDEVNRIFTLKELEKQPEAKVANFTVTSLLDPDDVLTPDEEAKVDACLRRIGEIVRIRKLHVKPMFQAKVRGV